ncbi:retrovirus-related pol polyprotein from transposon TNT 1-94 [Tanacetum coccineum]
MNTKFVNNLPAYWGKYVTNVKQNMDISTTPYVQIYTHLKAYEPHAKKTLKKQEQSTSIVDPPWPLDYDSPNSHAINTCITESPIPRHLYASSSDAISNGNPQEFFLLRNIYLLRNEFGMSRGKTEEILNHLDELSLDRIEHIEGKIKGLGNGRDCNNQNALEIPKFLEYNDLKAQLQDKDSTICKLKDIIKSIREKSMEKNVKYDYGEIETKNVFKEQFDSIKKTCVRTKEQSDSLIDKLNLKSAKNEDLKAQIQDKVFVITSLKNDLQKLKGKEIVDIAAQTPSTHTIVPGMFKLDLEPLAPSCANLLRKSMFDGVHDMCLLDFVENVNSRAKSAKKNKKLNIWKPTGHVFTEVGLKWKPTSRTFNIVGNSCPLTRITSANVVPPKKTTSDSVETQKPELKVYNRKPKNVKNVGSSKKYKIVESKNAIHSEPNHTWGFNATDIPSSFSLVMIGTVRFGNDNITRIMGYGDYQLGNVTISRVYYVEGLGHNLFSVGQFCDADLEVAFRKNTCFIRNLDRMRMHYVFFGNAETLREFYENAGISHQTSVARTPQQNGVVERRNRTLVEAARTIIYNKRTGKIIETIHMAFDELTAMASKQFSSGPGLHSMTPATSSLGLVSNPVSQQPCIPPKRDDSDRLFQPMFDEYFNPLSIVVSPVQEVVAPRAMVLANSHVSTSIDQDAPSTSIPST